MHKPEHEKLFVKLRPVRVYGVHPFRVSGESELIIQAQCESNTYRLIVFGENGAEILLVPTGDKFALPFVTVPARERTADGVTTGSRVKYGLEVVCLSELTEGSDNDASPLKTYQVAEHWRTIGASELPSRWVALSQLSSHSFTECADFATVCRSLEQSKKQHDRSAPFIRLGWFGELREWITDAIAPHGLRLVEGFHQLGGGASFSLIRFEAGKSALWFKAVGAPATREFAITCLLAEKFPRFLPQILATRPDWNAWLSREAAGTELAEIQDLSLWTQAVRALAELQIESVAHSDQILSAGAHNLKCAQLREVVLPFTDAMLQLMDRQTKPPPPILDSNDIASLGATIFDVLDQSAELGIPDTLGHLDLNPGNILVSERTCTFLDWAEAYVGHPFLSFQYLLEHLRKMGAQAPGIEAQLIEAYTTPWRLVVSANVIAECLRIAPLVAVFAYATGSGVWHDEEELQAPETAGYLRSLTRRMYREAKQFSTEAACLS